MDYEFELEKFNFKAKTELSSFSDACESRLRDRFHNLFYDLRTTGTSEENLNILQSAKIMIDNKPRRALDLVSITVEPEQINFFSSSGQALAGVKEYMISEKGFKKVIEDPRSGKITVKLPKLTFENKMELSDSIDGKYGTFQKNITGVKAQTGTQIRAGLTNELLINLSAPVLLNLHTQGNIRGRVMGIWGSFMPAGNAVIILIAPIIYLVSDWQLLWTFSAIYTAIILFFGSKIIPNDPEHFKNQIIGKTSFLIKQTIGRWSIIITGTTFACHSLIFLGTMQFLPYYFEIIAGYTETISFFNHSPVLSFKFRRAFILWVFVAKGLQT